MSMFLLFRLTIIEKTTMEQCRHSLWRPRVLISVTAMFLSWSPCQCFSTSDVKRLLDDLALDYDVTLRPVVNQSRPVVIDTDFIVAALSELNSVDQTINLRTYFKFTWTDESLVWNPDQYNGVDVINPPMDRIWMPSLVLLNSLDSHEAATGGNAYPVRVNSSGRVHWVIPLTLFTTCSMDMTMFPVDEHTCEYYISVNGYSGDQVMFKIPLNKTDPLRRSLGDGQFTFKNYSFTVYDSFNLLGEDKSGLVLTVTMKRLPDYFLIHLLFPVTALSFLSVFVFTLPGSSGDKVSYSITVLLSVMLYQSSASSYLPMNSETTPNVVRFLTFITTLCVLSVIASLVSVFVQNKWQSTSKEGDLSVTSQEQNLQESSPRENSDVNNRVPLQPITTGVASSGLDLVGSHLSRHLDKYFLVVFLTIWIGMTFNFSLFIWLQ